jgi:hypothetical protein
VRQHGAAQALARPSRVEEEIKGKTERGRKTEKEGKRKEKNGKRKLRWK